MTKRERLLISSSILKRVAMLTSIASVLIGWKGFVIIWRPRPTSRTICDRFATQRIRSEPATSVSRAKMENQAMSSNATSLTTMVPSYQIVRTIRLASRKLMDLKRIGSEEVNCAQNAKSSARIVRSIIILKVASSVRRNSSSQNIWTHPPPLISISPLIKR